jgi:uncharacterized protein (TIGR02996 family)
MSDLHDLIRACKAEPDDDAPRLVLADWLEEHGEEARAKFIRRQVLKPARLAEDVPPDPRWFGEWSRWLEGEHADIIRQFPDPDSPSPVHFVRGFMRVRDVYSELYRELSSILGPTYDWTWLEGIKFGSWHDGDWTPLFESPRLRELNRLAFIDDHYRSNLVEPLLSSPHVENLRYLELVMVTVDDYAIERLSQYGPLSGLRSLDLAEMGIGPAGARALARSELWDGLRRCSIQGSRMGDNGLAEFAVGRRRPHLRRLDLAIGAYTDEGLRALAKSDRFAAVTELGIGYRTGLEPATSFGRPGVEAIIQSATFSQAKVTVSIISDEPVPPDLDQLARAHPSRLSIRYRNPRLHLDFETLGATAPGHSEERASGGT